MITWIDKDISIGVVKFPDRKKPALFVMEGFIETKEAKND